MYEQNISTVGIAVLALKFSSEFQKSSNISTRLTLSLHVFDKKLRTMRQRVNAPPPIQITKENAKEHVNAFYENRTHI
jgi:adenine C2-methylase RlmN of 23S rRNA A2503 and tRNA A37